MLLLWHGWRGTRLHCQPGSVLVDEMPSWEELLLHNKSGTKGSWDKWDQCEAIFSYMYEDYLKHVPYYMAHLFLAEITLNRSCCRVEIDSTICPPGDDYQVQETENFVKYFTRCNTELCNTSTGDENNDDADPDGGGSSSAIIIVPGGSGVARHIPSALSSVFGFLAILILRRLQ